MEWRRLTHDTERTIFDLEWTLISVGEIVKIANTYPEALWCQWWHRKHSARDTPIRMLPFLLIRDGVCKMSCKTNGKTTRSAPAWAAFVVYSANLAILLVRSNETGAVCTAATLTVLGISAIGWLDGPRIELSNNTIGFFGTPLWSWRLNVSQHWPPCRMKGQPCYIIERIRVCIDNNLIRVVYESPGIFGVCFLRGSSNGRYPLSYGNFTRPHARKTPRACCREQVYLVAKNIVDLILTFASWLSHMRSSFKCDSNERRIHRSGCIMHGAGTEQRRFGQ